jgi:sigma-B regulation protein RsbU (phosphoserine phosphatase)
MNDPDDEMPGATTVGSLLVVDDDESNRDLLARRLSRRGHDVVAAADGRRALELVASRPFDVVLLDVMMPEMSGLEVLQALRQTYAPAELPVIMATARNQSDDVVEALRMGANDYVTKPLDFPVVLARVQSQLSLKRAVEEAARLENRLAERNRELEGLNARLASANRRMERDLHAAARVQESFLPGPSPALPGARCTWVYRPCEELAGDGLNAFPLDGRRSGLYLFDVCGHGVASALLSVSICRVLSPPGDPMSLLVRGPEHAVTGVDGDSGLTGPAELAERLNAMFPFDQASQYFTMVYGILDLDAEPGGLRYVSAGHPGLVHLPASGVATVLDGRGFPVGLAQSAYEEQLLPLAPGDRVFFYSDGILEAADPRGRPFGAGRLLEAVERGRGRPLGRTADVLVDEVVAWCGDAGPRDDISLLAVEVAVPGDGSGRA